MSSPPSSSSQPVRPRTRERIAPTNLQRAWEDHASAFITWARQPNFDSYWRFHRDQFLPLVPKPGLRTLDLGCGEGRVSRDLARLGHRVVGVDPSSTMLTAASAETPRATLTRASAAALPFARETFDCVVAFMSLQDIDDLENTVAETNRILRPGGHLCLATVHPVNSAGNFETDTSDSPFIIDGSYLEPSYYADRIVRGEMQMTFVSIHRPLTTYTETLAETGFLIERLREPALPDHGITNPGQARWQRLPLFLHILAVKRG